MLSAALFSATAVKRSRHDLWRSETAAVNMGTAPREFTHDPVSTTACLDSWGVCCCGVCCCSRATHLPCMRDRWSSPVQDTCWSACSVPARDIYYAGAGLGSFAARIAAVLACFVGGREFPLLTPCHALSPDRDVYTGQTGHLRLICSSSVAAGVYVPTHLPL